MYTTELNEREAGHYNKYAEAFKLMFDSMRQEDIQAQQILTLNLLGYLQDYLIDQCNNMPENCNPLPGTIELISAISVTTCDHGLWKKKLRKSPAPDAK